MRAPPAQAPDGDQARAVDRSAAVRHGLAGTRDPGPAARRLGPVPDLNPANVDVHGIRDGRTGGFAVAGARRGAREILAAGFVTALSLPPSWPCRRGSAGASSSPPSRPSAWRSGGAVARGSRRRFSPEPAAGLGLATGGAAGAVGDRSLRRSGDGSPGALRGRGRPRSGALAGIPGLCAAGLLLLTVRHGPPFDGRRADDAAGNRRRVRRDGPGGGAVLREERDGRRDDREGQAHALEPPAISRRSSGWACSERPGFSRP